MLTKTDLNQIRSVVHEEVDVVVEERLEKGLGTIREDISGLKQDMGTLKQDVGNLQKDMKYLKKKVNRIDRTVNLVVKNYDETDVKLEKRVRKIESHIGLIP